MGVGQWSPGHATVDGKVDRIGDTDERVDEEDNVPRHVIVHKLVHTVNSNNNNNV